MYWRGKPGQENVGVTRTDDFETKKPRERDVYSWWIRSHINVETHLLENNVPAEINICKEDEKHMLSLNNLFRQ